MQGLALGGGALGWYGYLIEEPAATPTPSVTIGGGASMFPFPLLKKRRDPLEQPSVLAAIKLLGMAAPGQVINVPAPVTSPIRSRQGVRGEVVRVMRRVRAWDSVRLSARRGVLVRPGAGVEVRMSAVYAVPAGDPSLTLLEVAVLA